MVEVVENKNKFPLFKTIFASFSLFFDNIWSSVIIGSVFSLIYMVINFIGGQSLFCYSRNYSASVFCVGNFYLFILSNLFLWFLACVYMRNWYNVVILKTQKFSIKDILPQMTDVKLFGVLGLFFVALLIACGVGAVLFVREPNPNWKIELIYFSLISIGFLAPIFAMPLLSFIAFVAEKTKIPTIKELWNVSKGKFTVMFISFVSVVLFSFLLMSFGLRYFVQLAVDGNIFVIVIAEFLYNIVLMFIASIFTNYCYIQKKFLFERS